MTDEAMFEYVISNIKLGQVRGEILWALGRIREYFGGPVSNVLEIGSWQGGNLCMLSQLMENGGVLVGIEAGPSTGYEDAGVRLDVVKPVIGSINLQVIEKYSKDAISDVAALVNRYGKLSVIYFDATHTKEAVKFEHENYNQFLDSPGVLVFHDIASGKISDLGVEAVGHYWDEIKWWYSYEEKRMKWDESEYHGVGILFL